METAAAQLLCCSLLCFGLLALWVAHSTRHWFIRWAIFLAALFPFILIPAYEPAVTFAIEGLTVCCGLWLLRRFTRRDSQSDSQLTFGIPALLQAMVILAAIVAVGIKLPRLNAYAWCNVVGVGTIAGIWICVAIWIVNGQWRNALLRSVVGVLAVLLLALPISFFDTTLNSFVVGWPAHPDANAFLAALGALGRRYQGFLFWIPLALALTAGLVVFLLIENRIKRSAGRIRWLWTCLLVLLVFPVCVPPVGVLFQLLTPTPFPEIVQIDDNGYDDLFAAGKIADKWKFNTSIYGSDEAPLNELRSAVAEMNDAYVLLELGLPKHVQYPLTSFDPQQTLAGASELRSLARASSGRARLAAREGNFEQAARYHLQTVKFGHLARKNGLMVHYLVGMACSGIGYYGLYEVKDELALNQCEEIASALKDYELSSETFEAVVGRDEAWTQRAYGWHGHLGQILHKVIKEDPNWSFHQAFFREHAESRLLRTEFALAAFRRQTGELPGRLSQLVPVYLQEVPIDPYSLEETPLQYRIEDGSYVLYSLGANQKDDGGVIPVDYSDSPSTWGIYGDGDLRLKYRMAPEPEEAEPEDAGNEFQPYDYEEYE